jgi:uncharacterized protein (TIGR04255 family)
MSTAVFMLDLDETFPHLNRPPIVEAVIHWQARAQNALEPDALAHALAARLPQYDTRESIHQIELMAMMTKKEKSPVVQHSKGWQGIRLKSANGNYEAQFTRDGLIFSRRHGYEHWTAFTSAAMEVWKAYLEIAAPIEIQRLGVRYINHLVEATPQTLGDFLREPPTCPSNLPLMEFVYQSTFSVPGHPFGIRVIKVMQPVMPELRQSSGLFIDLDVYTVNAISCESVELALALTHMRWLKNKVFFTLLTDQAVNSFDGSR